MFNAHLSIPFGIIAGLFASFVQSLGLTIQRKSHVLNQALPEHRQRVEHRRPLWLLGFAIFISSNILGSLVQIASLPVVILAPLGAVSLLWNAFFARFILGDVFSPWMILATILIAGGAILIAFFGIVPEPTRSLEDLLHLFRRPAFIVYFSILGFVVIFCLAITHITEFSLSRRIDNSCLSDSSSTDLSPSSTNIYLPAHASDITPVIDVIEDPLATERTPLLYRKAGSMSPSSKPINPTLRTIHRTRLLLAISFASFSGIISGMCLLFAKSGVELLLLTLTGNNQFWRWETWVLVLGLILFALLQLWYLHKALIYADPTLVCPSAFCFYNLSSIMNGLVYFDQFSLIPPVHLGLVILGIFVLLGGVWVVSIQSGGGGIDVGTWTKSDDFSCDERMLLPDSEDPEGNIREVAAVSMAEQSVCKINHPARPGIGPVGMERETLSESNIPISPQMTRSGLDDPARDPSLSPVPTTGSRRPRAHTQLYSTPQRPSQRSLRRSVCRGLTTDVPQSPMSMQSGESRTVSLSHLQASHSPPLGPVSVSTIGTGFQIGLSPLSPGFTILPLDRRRRTSGIGTAGRSSFADVANDIIIGLREAETERRRTVSEGELTRRDLNGVQDASRSNEVGEEGVGERGIDGTREQLEGRRGWRWIRKVFTGKD